MGRRIMIASRQHYRCTRPDPVVGSMARRHKSNPQVSDHGAVLWDDFARKNRIVSSMTMYDTAVAVKERNLSKKGRLGSKLVLDNMVD